MASLIRGTSSSSLSPHLHAHGPWETLKDCVYCRQPCKRRRQLSCKSRGERIYFSALLRRCAGNHVRLMRRVSLSRRSILASPYPEAIELGRAADSFVRDQLSNPFTVSRASRIPRPAAKWSASMHLCETKDGDLGEQLVTNGFARIYGTTATAARTCQLGRRKAQHSRGLKMRRSKSNSAVGALRRSNRLFATSRERIILRKTFHLIRKKKILGRQRSGPHRISSMLTARHENNLKISLVSGRF